MYTIKIANGCFSRFIIKYCFFSIRNYIFFNYRKKISTSTWCPSCYIFYCIIFSCICLSKLNRSSTVKRYFSIWCALLSRTNSSGNNPSIRSIFVNMTSCCTACSTYLSLDISIGFSYNRRTSFCRSRINTIKFIFPIYRCASGGGCTW